MSRLVFLDTETTGLDPFEGHRIVEIGAVEMTDGNIGDGVYHVYINPERDMPESAFSVHGLSGEFLQDKPIFKTIYQDFLNFIGDDPLVIHNAPFDMKFLNWELSNIGVGNIASGRLIDTLDLARRKYPGAQNSLDALCRRFSIDLSSRDSGHGALIDARLLAHVYVELTGGKQHYLSLSSVSRESVSDSGVLGHDMGHDMGYAHPPALPRARPLGSFMHADDYARHRRFIDDELGSSGSPIWRIYSDYRT